VQVGAERWAAVRPRLPVGHDLAPLLENPPAASRSVGLSSTSLLSSYASSNAVLTCIFPARARARPAKSSGHSSNQ